MLVHVGQHGSNNDSGVLAHSAIGHVFDNNSKWMSDDCDLGLPYYLVGERQNKSIKAKRL